MDFNLVVLSAIATLFLIVLIFGRAVVNVGGSQVGIMERRYLGKPLPEARVIAMAGEIGFQANSLQPGLHVLTPFIYRVGRQPMTIVREDEVGLVESIDGLPLLPGQIFARRVAGHDSFQDGQAFLRNGGQKGPQVDILGPGKYRINTYLFHVRLAPAVNVMPGHVGIVSARDGAPIPSGRLLAQKTSGHDAYGGQRGPQFDLLKPGTYYLNPLMFNVKLDDVAVVSRGEVAVLVSNVGGEPDKLITDERLRVGQERYVVPAGYRGIQSEVAGPGVYYLNRWAYIPYIIPTTNITIDWAVEETSTAGTEEAIPCASPQTFDPLTVISRDGFEMRVSVKVIIRVRPDQAPLMVAKIGSIENLIDHVVHPMIDSSFRNQASSTEAMRFMQDRALEQEKAEERARLEMVKYHVECVSVLISQIILPQELMEIQTMRVIAAQQQEMYVQQQQAEERRIATASTRATADKQSDLVAAQIGAQIAQQTKQKTIIEAEGQARAIEVTGEAEGRKILAIGSATAEAYEKQVKAVGQLNLTGIEVAKAVAGAGLKITPDILVGGNGTDGNSGVFTAFIAQLLRGNHTNGNGKPAA